MLGLNLSLILELYRGESRRIASRILLMEGNFHFVKFESEFDLRMLWEN